MPTVRSFVILPSLPDSLRDLDLIARNMYWTWDPEFIGLFKRIDRKLWNSCGHNPVKLLGNVSQEKLEALANNQGFLCEFRRAVEKLQSYIEGPNWFQQTYKGQEPTIAYFSAEFGIHECLPIYSGGLGILAGDYLKSASDLGVPLVGMGLLYQKGYFRQYLNVDGWQQEVYVENNFCNMPIELERNADGEPISVSVQYPGRFVIARVWSVAVGRVKLYLLDTNVEANAPEDRVITSNLYGGDNEMRIRQEVMLGIGGTKALTTLGIKPTVCHMNEGHAAFMGLEKIRQLRNTYQISFDEAMEASKSGNVFTVHTPIKAGNDEFTPDMMTKYFGNYLPDLGLDKKKFLGLGRVNPNNNNESFKMPVLAIKLSSYRNGVSQAHGEVSRQIWSGLWPNIPVDEVPIDSVTNGIHVGSWLSKDMSLLYDRYLGLRWSGETVGEAVWENIAQIPDEELWRTHQRCKERLVVFARKRLKAQIQRRGTYHTELNWAEEVLDPEALTIGFARRFATYKRGNLLLKNPQRLIKLLTNQERPLQIIFAGKAHPKDSEGKEIIRQIVHFASQYEVRRRVVFLEDYDIDVARYLVQGVDIWLNTPRPPMEASGTSGMKAAVNGVLNMSTLDGWWSEGYSAQVGWAIGAGENYDETSYQDMVESQAIYNILENEAIPLFYTRSKDKLPRAWINRMKKSIKSATPRFNTHRMLVDYTEKFYQPAAQRWQDLNTEDMLETKAFASWKLNIQQAWPELAIKDVIVDVNDAGIDEHMNSGYPQLNVGSELKFKALVHLGTIEPKDVAVELYYGPIDAWGKITHGSALRMTQDENSTNDNTEHWFTGLMKCKQCGRQGIAVRVLPKHPDLVSPHELGLIIWETPTTEPSLVTI